MSGSSRKRSLVEEWNADTWYREFFNQCHLPEPDAESYAIIFSQNGIQWDMLHILSKDLLKEMKINKVGHIIEILRTAHIVSSRQQRSEISHNNKPPAAPASSPTVQSKVVSLKSVVNLKDRRTRRENEVGGAKRDLDNLKRSLPDEGPTLSVKMPNRIKPPVQINVPENNSSPSIVRTVSKELEPVEVSSSTEKKQKRSVFERLGTVNASQVPQSSHNSSSSSVGILKKSQTPSAVKGPLKFPTSSTVKHEPRRCQSPARLGANTFHTIGRAQSPFRPSEVRVPSPHRSRSPGPSVAKQHDEPSFHVTVNRLSNPLVNKVPNGPLNKRQQERRNNVSNFSSTSNSRTNMSASASDKMNYGSMAADQLEMSKGFGVEKDLKQRLGNRPNSWSKSEVAEDKKRVSFGVVRTKEIPALPGTQPVSQSPNSGSPLLARRFYTGSIALRTAKRVS